MVTVKTGCKDCGDLPALIYDAYYDRAYIKIIGELPHSLKHKERGRWLWVDIKKLTPRARDE